MEWQERVQRELETADAARQRGNEGMARVCARRAAGWTVQAFLAAQGIDLETNSVIDHFRYLQKDNQVLPEVLPLLQRLQQPKLRPKIEQDSYFPEDVDVLADARQLIALLFPTQNA